MERTLYAERLYSLGDFKNIKFSNALTGIPEELASNPRVVELLYVQQFLAIEIAYRRYYNTIDKITREKIVDILEFLEAERTQTFQELSEEIRKTENHNKET